MAISRSQITKQVEGKLRGARGEKKRKSQAQYKPYRKKPKVFKI